MAPLAEMLRILLSYIPNVAAAAVSIGLGWVVARILRQVVRNLLAGAGLDRAVERAGLAPATGGVRLSALVGTIVYFVIWIPFIIAGLDALKIEAISRPAINALDTLLAWVPKGLGGAVLLILAWVVSRLVGNLVTQLLRGVGFDQSPGTAGPGGAPAAGRADALRFCRAGRPGRWSWSLPRRDLRGHRAAPAGRVRGPAGGLHDQRGDRDGHRRRRTLGREPRASGLSRRPLERTGTRHPQTIAALAKYAVVIFAFAMALQQIGFGEAIVVWAFVLLFGAVCLALALAFGLGSREAAARAVDRALGEGPIVGSSQGGVRGA